MSSARTFPLNLGVSRMPAPPVIAPRRVLPQPVSRPTLVELPVVRIRAASQPGTPVLNQDLFRGALVRERKRADRSNQPFAVLLVDLTHASENGSLPRGAVEALVAVKGDADIVGWFSEGVLGVLFPELKPGGASLATDLEARVRQELGRRFKPAVVARFSIGLHLYAGSTDAGHAGAMPVDQLIASHARGNRVYDAGKRLLDILLSAALLAMLSPLLLVIAAVVKATSRGPVLFQQVRVGKTATRFPMLKFRTMYADADHGIHKEFVTQFIQSGGAAATGTEVFKITNDPRVTPVGRILRKTSLDELPQLWNVLRGEMSLVGPRPPLAYEVEQYKPWHRRRVLEAKPGITGLWQVMGRSRTTFDDMVRLDLRYARTCSLWTDLKILLATPSAVIAGKGAC